MAKLNILSVAANRVIAKAKSSRVMAELMQSRIVISAISLGVNLALLMQVAADSIGLSESLAKVFGKNPTDTSSATDQLAKDVGAVQDEQFLATDSAAISAGKAFQDGGFAFDSLILQSSYNRGFTDLADAGDSVSLSVSYFREFSESLSVSDLISYGILLPLNLGDDAYTSDQVAIVAGYNRQYTTSAIAEDSSILTAGIPGVDFSSTSDIVELQVGYFRSIQDSVYSTDDIGGEATIDDDQTIQFFKQVTNIAQALESSVMFAGKVLGDILGTTDSGTILAQDYVDDPFYFAEDYVGVKRTF